MAVELPLRVGLGQSCSIGLDVQAIYLSGGFLDRIIEAWHNLCGFPKNSRDILPRNRVLLDLDTTAGPSFHGDQSAFLVADPVLSFGWGMIQSAQFNLGGQALCAIPLGLGGGVAGTGLPQLGLAVSADWWPLAWLGVHGLSGAVLPLESFKPHGPWPMIQARLSFIANFGWEVQPYLDFNLRTSPIQTTVYDRFGDYFARPNTDLRFGLLWAGSAARQRGEFGAFTVQEDPFTHNSSDVSLQGGAAFRL